jgi:hypothetical protein
MFCLMQKNKQKMRGFFAALRMTSYKWCRAQNDNNRVDHELLLSSAVVVGVELSRLTGVPLLRARRI